MPVSNFSSVNFEELYEELVYFTDSCFKFLQKGNHSPYNDNGKDKAFWHYIVGDSKYTFSLETGKEPDDLFFAPPEMRQNLFCTMYAKLWLMFDKGTICYKVPYLTKKSENEKFRFYGEIKGVGHILTVEKTKR